jgi:hypothetical protein
VAPIAEMGTKSRWLQLRKWGARTLGWRLDCGLWQVGPLLHALALHGGVSLISAGEGGKLGGAAARLDRGRAGEDGKLEEEQGPGSGAALDCGGAFLLL